MNDNKTFWSSLSIWWKSWFVISAPVCVYFGLVTARMMEVQGIPLEAVGFFLLAASALTSGTIYTGVIILIIKLLVVATRFIKRNHKISANNDDQYWLKAFGLIVLFAFIYWIADTYII